MERILRLQAQIDDIKGDIREIYAEEKADGGDKTAMGAAISYIRKREKDGSALAEREAMVDVYLAAYEGPRAHTHTREAKSYAEAKGIDPRLVETIVKGVQTDIGRAALVTALDVMIEREEAETNSPETATRLGQDVQSPRQCTSAPENLDVTAGETATNSEMHQRPSNNDEPSPEAGPQAEASLAGTGTGTLAGREGRSEGEAASADLPTDFQPPAFLTKQKTIADYRPNCLNPEACGSSGLNHCFRCAKAAGDAEAA